MLIWYVALGCWARSALALTKINRMLIWNVALACWARSALTLTQIKRMLIWYVALGCWARSALALTQIQRILIWYVAPACWARSAFGWAECWLLTGVLTSRTLYFPVNNIGKELDIDLFYSNSKDKFNERLKMVNGLFILPITKNRDISSEVVWTTEIRSFSGFFKRCCKKYI